MMIQITSQYRNYKPVQKLLPFTFIFLVVDNSVNIIQRVPKLSVLILAMVIKGMVSQFCYLGPSSRFMCFKKIYTHIFLMFPDFWHKMKTKILIKNLRHSSFPMGRKNEQMKFELCTSQAAFHLGPGRGKLSQYLTHSYV